MKRKITLPIAMTTIMIVMSSCTKQPLAPTLSQSSYTLYHTTTEEIKGKNLNGLLWAPENEFVATVTDGTITGHYVGSTTITEPEHGLSFSVSVEPQYHLYDEPDMSWGATSETIRNRYGAPDATSSSMYMYRTSNSKVPAYIYSFNNGKLESSAALVSISAAEELVNFLSERYEIIKYDASSVSATFAHMYGKISNPKFDYGVGFAYTSTYNALLVMYMPNTSSSKAGVGTTDILQAAIEEARIRFEALLPQF